MTQQNRDREDESGSKEEKEEKRATERQREYT